MRIYVCAYICMNMHMCIHKCIYTHTSIYVHDIYIYDIH